jgi:uncharacterized protein YidB (DUF937 family)
MGIMDTIQNTVASGSQSTGAIQIVSNLMNQSGGIQGLMQKFQQHGLGNIMQSWIGKGSNLPVEPEQLRPVIGEENLGQMAQQSGLQQGDVLHKLSQFLPQVVDKLTPDGQVQSENFSGSNVLSVAKNLFH